MCIGSNQVFAAPIRAETAAAYTYSGWCSDRNPGRGTRRRPDRTWMQPRRSSSLAFPASFDTVTPEGSNLLTSSARAARPPLDIHRDIHVAARNIAVSALPPNRALALPSGGTHRRLCRSNSSSTPSRPRSTGGFFSSCASGACSFHTGSPVIFVPPKPDAPARGLRHRSAGREAQGAFSARSARKLALL